MALPYVWISSELVHMHLRTRLVYIYVFETGFFGQNMVLRPTSSSAVTTATMHLPIQIWLFLFIPQITYLHTKNEEGLKIFISNCASLSWRIALKRNFSTNHNYPNSFTKLVAGTATNFTFGKWSKDFTTRKWNFPRPFQNLIHTYILYSLSS